MIGKFIELIREDVRSVYERDPAARSTLEILLTYPGLQAIWGYRIAHWLWTHRMKLAGRMLSNLMRGLTGVEIHPGAKIGRRFFIDHGMGVVIGETTTIGSDVTLYHGVTLGGVSTEKGKRHPDIGDGVVIGAGAKVLGAIEVGEYSRVGANAVVVKPVPSNSVVVGVPGQVVMRSKPHPVSPDLHHEQLPDTIGASLTAVMARMEKMERKLRALETGQAAVLVNGNGNGSGLSNGEMMPHAPEHGMWRGEDFMI